MKTYLLFLICTLLYLQIKAQDQSFEEASVPTNWNASLGNLSISAAHYKLGTKSLQWNWSANDVLTISNLQNNGLVTNEVLGYFQNMFRMWFYNTSAIDGENIEFEFYDNNNVKQFYYPFYINFTGWRAASASYKEEMLGNKTSTNITTLKIKAPSTGNGTFFIDFVDYTMARNTSRSADYQLPFLQKNNGEHWGDIMYFQSLPKTVALVSPTNQELNDLNSIKQKYDAIILGSSPNSSNLNSAITKYNNQNIQYNNEIISGVPIYGADYSDTQNINIVDEFILIFARDYQHNNNASSLTYFLNSVRYLLDQGFADGSAMETVHHIGYRFRNIARAIHLMKKELENVELWTPAQKMVEWYSAVDLIWNPTANKSNLDDGITRAQSILGACLYKNTNEEKVQYLKGYKLYLENWLTLFSREGEGLKTDYTAFHHNTWYPQYAFGAYKGIAETVNLTSGGVYQINHDKIKILKNILLTARITMNKNNFPNSLSGRTPFSTFSITQAYKNIGLVPPIDEQLLGAYNYINGSDQQTNTYALETPPVGFWQINYANMGAYRQDNWVANIKGFNKYFWGTEIYTSDNRYGRYQSYGAVEILYSGGHINSGVNILGWDWTKTPGATTIALSWSDLVASNSRQDETTNSNFAASLRFKKKNNAYIDSKLEGEYGVFGMDFTQKAITSTHNNTFTFKKSVFCFNGKIICLGSNISNNNANNNTTTNLFQNYLTNTNQAIVVNNTSITTFPYSQITSNKNDYNWIIDAYNTGYYIKKGDDIVINRQNQTSPNENGNGTFTNGNFATAYINHQQAPNNASYEYVIIPNANNSIMENFTNNMQNNNTAFYNVIQQNSTAHIIKHNTIYGYSLFTAGDYGTTTPLKSNDQPCLVMLDNNGQNMDISVVNPDLNFASNNGDSQSKTINLILNGNWSVTNNNGNSVQTNINADNNTVLTINAKDGLPVDISLTNNNSSFNNTYYPYFYYEDFRYTQNRGYQIQVVANSGQDVNEIGKAISDIPDNTDSNNKFSDTRPTHRIPEGSARDQKAIAIKGASSSENFAIEAWVVLNTLDLSETNNYLSDDPHKYVSFWTETRYANGGTSHLSLQISTDYSGDVTTATWTDVTDNLNQIAQNNDANNLIYLKSLLDISEFNSNTFTLAFKYTSNNSPYSSTNRNGTFYIADVAFFTAAENLSNKFIEKESPFIIYPNPSQGIIHIQNNENKPIQKISVMNMLGQIVHEQKNSHKINLQTFPKGIYFVLIQSNSSSTYVHKIINK
ncbi:chondroitinase family polysaccharide lyase [Wenyingzhuangia sp. IMCC45467]